MRARVLPATHPHIRPAQLSNLLVICWSGPPNQAVVDPFRGLLAGMRRAWRDGFGLLHVIDHRQPPAPMEVRRQLVEAQDEVAAELLGAVAAIASPGMYGAMLRGVMTGMIMLARKPYPRKITGTVSEARTWLYDLGVARDCSYVELADLVETLRASYETAAPAGDTPDINA